MDTRSASRDTASLPTDLSGLADLTPAQWGRIGAGAALALTGTGLLSLGTIVRLAAVLGGGAVVYQTLKSAGSAAGEPASVSSNLTPSAWAARPSLRGVAPAHDADTDGATMEGSEPVPFGDLRGT